MSNRPRHSYGGGQRRYYDGDSGRGPDRRESYIPESREQRLRGRIYKCGDEETLDVSRMLPGLATDLSKHLSADTAVVAEALRIGAVEQPYKAAHYAALIALLVEPGRVRKPDTNGTSDRPDLPVNPSPGRGVLEEVFKGFQTSLDRLVWRDIRISIHLFAHLTLAEVISPASLLELLQSFIAVLDEPGVSYGRGLQAALCAGEGFLVAGKALYDYSSESVAEMVTTLDTFSSSGASAKGLVQPIVGQYSAGIAGNGRSYDVLESLVACLRCLLSSSFVGTPSPVPAPYDLFPPTDTSSESLFTLPTVLVPPEIIELHSLAGNATDEEHTNLPGGQRDFPEAFIRLFENDVTPAPSSLTGYMLRSVVTDTINIFEVNRKEGARVLTELPKWVRPGTFKVRTPSEGSPEGDWALEVFLVETILSCSFVLPRPLQKAVYYASLLTDLCKLSPQTAGPAVGKSIRKLYSMLGDGLSVEVSRRFAEWFAVHMSNFGFTWVWKEWISDLYLPSYHPKRKFMRRAIELEIRLSYYDRILKTLPEQISDPEAETAPAEAPTGVYRYESADHEHYGFAKELSGLFGIRTKVEEVTPRLEIIKQRLADVSGLTSLQAEQAIRPIVMESLLHIGSRSFSHLLNAMERYLPLLRSMSTTPDAKSELLDASSSFWRHNQQNIHIVFDKLMQYQIVDPVDIIKWSFRKPSPETKDVTANGHVQSRTLWLTTFNWEVLRAALDKANGRVLIAKRRVAAVRKDDDDARARLASTTDGATMEADEDGKDDDPTRIPESKPTADSPTLTTALKAHMTLNRDQKSALAAALSCFVQLLLLTPEPNESNAWEARAGWSKAEWECWETWGWFRQFCIAFSPYLRSYRVTFGMAILSDLQVPEGCDSSSPTLIKAVWEAALGVE